MEGYLGLFLASFPPAQCQHQAGLWPLVCPQPTVFWGHKGTHIPKVCCHQRGPRDLGSATWFFWGGLGVLRAAIILGWTEHSQ